MNRRKQVKVSMNFSTMQTFPFNIFEIKQMPYAERQEYIKLYHEWLEYRRIKDLREQHKIKTLIYKEDKI